MKVIVINSPKYGRHEVMVDDEDYELVSGYTWTLSCYKSRYSGEVTIKYASTQIGGRKNTKKFRMHRLIMGFPSQSIDHKDMNGLNNTRQNLRIVNGSQNMYNMPKKKWNKSGYKGVSWRPDKRKFQCQIKVNRIHIHAGYFETAIDVAKKYNELALMHHGEFANINQL